MKKIYQNFDGLDMSFQCAVPAFILDKLDAAQKAAQQSRQGEIISLGKNKAIIEVADNGMKGGYAYRFDSGLDGAIWAVAKSDNPERWNVRVSVKSLCLALHGYEKTKEQIQKFLRIQLCAIPPEGHEEAVERVSRIDFCIDFLSEDEFEPNPEQFLTHNKCSGKEHRKLANDFPLDFTCNRKGRRMQGITIGKMPNRQLCVYNKTQEIKSSQKLDWWKIWNLNPEEIKNNIWRVEVRAGKKELNKYQLKRFSDFEQKAGDVIINILKDYRYVIPNENDKNRARWPLADFWKIAIKSSKDYLAEYICHAERKDIIIGHQLVILKRYQDHIKGVVTSYAAAQEIDVAQLPRVLDGINNDVLESFVKNPEKFQKNHEKAAKRFEFLMNKEIKQ